MADTYMMNPKDMNDDQLQRWVKNFQKTPPTMDYMGEYSWAVSLFKEAKSRGLN